MTKPWKRQNYPFQNSHCHTYTDRPHTNFLFSLVQNKKLCLKKFYSFGFGQLSFSLKIFFFFQFKINSNFNLTQLLLLLIFSQDCVIFPIKSIKRRKSSFGHTRSMAHSGISSTGQGSRSGLWTWPLAPSSWSHHRWGSTTRQNQNCQREPWRRNEAMARHWQRRRARGRRRSYRL